MVLRRTTATSYSQRSFPGYNLSSPLILFWSVPDDLDHERSHALFLTTVFMSGSSRRVLRKQSKVVPGTLLITVRQGDNPTTPIFGHHTMAPNTLYDLKFSL